MKPSAGSLNAPDVVAVMPSWIPRIGRMLRDAAHSPPPQAGAHGGTRGPLPQQRGTIAVVPMAGVLGIPTLFSLFFGDPLDRFASAFRQAVADPAVTGIVIAIDSPGGSVYGIDELASEIYQARGQKKIVSIASPLAASAAYYLGSQAHEMLVTPSGETGSIGVLAVHEDWSGAYAAAGVVPTIISAGKYKAEGNDTEPLSDEARAAIQSRVDDYYQMFIKAVARGRDVTAGEVARGFGQGRVVGAQEAVHLNLADRVGTLDVAVGRASRPAFRGAASALTDEDRQRQIELWNLDPTGTVGSAPGGAPDREAQLATMRDVLLRDRQAEAHGQR